MKTRLDQLVVDRGLAPSRDAAKRLILAGKIRIDGEVRDKAGKTYDVTSEIELVGPKSPYVGRGGEKLAGALEEFGLEIPPGAVALDIGASTGGFTDCLLQRGAARVVAVDTGRGQLHEKLRGDPRVTAMEKTNARYLTLEAIGGEPVELIAIDVSFISLRLILPPCVGLLAPNGHVIALVKPQFEAGRRQVGSGGIVRDPGVHREVLESFLGYCAESGWAVERLAVSQPLGADGNVEFFVLLSRSDVPPKRGPLARERIDEVLVLAERLQADKFQGA